MSACDEVIFQDVQTTMTPLVAPSQTKIAFGFEHKMGFALTPSVCGGRRWGEAGPAGSRKNVSRTAAAGQTEERRCNRKGAGRKQIIRRGGKNPKLHSVDGVHDTQPSELPKANWTKKSCTNSCTKSCTESGIHHFCTTFGTTVGTIFAKWCIAIAPLKFTFTTFLQLECAKKLRSNRNFANRGQTVVAAKPRIVDAFLRSVPRQSFLEICHFSHTRASVLPPLPRPPKKTRVVDYFS